MPVLEKLSDFSLCHQHRPDMTICLKALDNWLQKQPKDSWKAAKMVRINYKSSFALKYFNQAKNFKVFNCEDRDLQEAIISGLKLNNSEYKKISSIVRNISFNKCSKNLPKIISKEIHSNSSAFPLLCRELIKKHLLSNEEIKKCN